MRKLLLPLLVLGLMLTGCTKDAPTAPTQPSVTDTLATTPTDPSQTEPTTPSTKLVSVIETVVSTFGANQTRVERIFDAQNQVVEVITYAQEQVTQRYQVECDEHGNFVRWISGQSVTEYTYDREGRVTGTYAYLDGELQLSSRYVWEDGLLTATIQEIPIQNQQQRLDRIYDAQGRLIREDHSLNGSLASYTVYTYSDDGSALITAYAADGSVTQTAQQTVQGTELTVLTTSPDGSFVGKQVKTYDAQGNLLTDTEYDSNGSVVSQQRYTWRTVEVPLDCPRASN